MKFPYQILNTPFLLPNTSKYAYEVWYWKLNPLNEPWSFWFRFTLLKNANRNVAEVWGIYSTKNSDCNILQTQNTAIKVTFPIEKYRYQPDNNFITIKDNFVDFYSTLGHIHKDDKSIEWKLNLTPIAPQESFNFMPFYLWKLGIVKNYAVTTHEKILFNGTIKVNGKEIMVENALGMQGHLAGLKQGHSWAWAHSCIFYDEENGEIAPIIIDVLTARAKIGNKIVSPRLTTLFLHYEGKSYPLNSISDIIKTQSRYNPLYWEFKTLSPNVQISASIDADIDTVVGVQYEDTDASPLYCYNTKMANMKLEIYDRVSEKKKTFVSPSKCAFEWVQRELWDKVPISI